MDDNLMMRLLALSLLVLLLCGASRASTLTGPYTVSNIAVSAASSCSATDGSITLTIDPGDPGVSPYDVSLDNGLTWAESNLVPNGSGEILVSNKMWGTYEIAVRDDVGDVVYPGYAQITGCTVDVPALSGQGFSISAVVGATGYTWTTTIGSITAGQNTTSATIDFSSESVGATGSICALPTGPTCTAPATCFGVVVGATLSGTVFEDINYGGGPGRDYATADASAQTYHWTAGDIGMENVRIELYAADNSFITSTQTAADGSYSFSGVSSGDYYIRFATRTAVSMRASNSTGETPLAVPTFRSVGATTFTNEVGGADPLKDDALSNTTSADLDVLTTATAIAQAVSSVTVTTADVSGVDLGVSFSVISSARDAGIGTLRQFIINTNELANANLNLEDDPSGRPSLIKPIGTDVTIFEIPGTGVHTISLASEFPRLRDANTHFSGYTQNGAVQGTNSARTITIELVGHDLTYEGFFVYEDDVTISGFSIYNFLHAIYTNRTANSGAHVWGNYIGLHADGLNASTNGGSGVYFYGSEDAFIGINGDDLNDANEGNVVSNFEYGVNLSNCERILVAGNYVGTEKTGTASHGNDFVGVYSGLTTVVNWIGFKDDMVNVNPAHFRNVLSGNGNEGVRIVSCDNQVVSGNYVGLNVSGMALLSNTLYGVQITGNSSNNTVGTNANGDYDLLERNVIAGNIGFRLGSSGSGTGNTVAGNYFGTDITGNVSVGGEMGVLINGAYTNTIIGTNGDNVRDELEGNVISGHNADGLRFYYTGSTVVSGNKIGVGADGSTSMGNGDRGVYIEFASSDVTIGWSPSMANSDPEIVGNMIQNNVDNGVAMLGTGTGVRISRNAIADNGGLGIGLGNALYDFSVAENDNGDADTGENNLMNFPVFDKVILDGNDLTLEGYSPAGSTIEFFLADGGVNPSPLPAGYGGNFGEGETYLFTGVEGGVNDLESSTGVYNDDGTGAASARTENRFSFVFDVTGLGMSTSDYITSTATDASNNTSEFSGAVVVSVPEICNDLVDNDGDGLVDCADDDCPNVAPVIQVSH